MVANYSILVDGSIIFPHRGNPPMEVPGFEVDPGDPYRFFPVLPACKKRVFKKLQVPCCKDLMNITCCEKYDIPMVTPQYCFECARLGRHEP
jgi:hypothetical protein